MRPLPASLAVPPLAVPSFAVLCAIVLAGPTVAAAEDLGLRPAQEPQEEPAAATNDGEAALPDWTVLNWDVTRLMQPSSAPALPKRPAPAAGKAVEWKKNDNADGSAAVTVNRRLPTPLESKVGVDMNLAAQPSPMPQPVNPDQLIPGASSQQSSGTAWANVTAPGLDLPLGWDKTSLDARYDPLQEQRQIGTTLSKSIPVGAHSKVTLQNGYSVTHTLASPALPHLEAGSPPSPTSVQKTDASASLNLPTGTAFSVGTSMTSTDERWLRNFKAEQKLFGAINVTGTVSETMTGIPEKSLTAGFKRNW